MFNTIPEITANDIWSKIVSMSEVSAFIFFSVILVSLIYTTSSQRYSNDLTSLIRKIQRDGENMKSLIQEDYKMNSIEEAIGALQNVKAGMLNLIFWITNAI
jgi:hypothetical protein